jgi:predicted Zn-dependent protease
VTKEDQLAYDEPADWFFPTRHLLGAVLIQADRAADAETVYRDDLSRHPNNGWALYGLAQSLKMQGRPAEASTVQQQFDTAWKNADVTLVASAF